MISSLFLLNIPVIYLDCILCTLYRAHPIHRTIIWNRHCRHIGFIWENMAAVQVCLWLRWCNNCILFNELVVSKNKNTSQNWNNKIGPNTKMKFKWHWIRIIRMAKYDSNTPSLFHLCKVLNKNLRFCI